MNDTDDDLPPREEPIPPSYKEMPVESMNTEDSLDKDNAVPLDIPLRAGFDFKAIQDVIKSTEADSAKPLDIQATPKNPGTALPTISTSQRSGSAPPLVSPSRPSTINLRQSAIPHIVDEQEPIAGPSSLAPHLARSLFVRDLHSEPVTSYGDVPLTDSLHSAEPQLSFGSYDGSIWPFSSSDEHQSVSLMDSTEKSRLEKSTEFQPFGGGHGGFSSLGPVTPPPSSLPPINPFASTLSFGGPGGSISESPFTRLSASERDPWTAYSDSSKKSAISSPNPWS
jgi:hypothetical protein